MEISVMKRAFFYPLVLPASYMFLYAFRKVLFF